MKNTILLIVLFSSFFSQAKIALKDGMWLGQLAMNDRLTIPFQLLVSQKGKNVCVVNGAEKMQMDVLHKKDSLYLAFPFQDAVLVLHLEEGESSARGYWLNRNKKVRVKIPLTLTWNVEKRFPSMVETKPMDEVFTGIWSVTFQPGTKDAEQAVGIFKAENGSRITGTFLTETGDYRFLDGNRSGLNFSMSTFNGSWAMLFEATLDSDTLRGSFYSGPSYVTQWIAVRNPNAQLRNEASLTYVVNDQALITKDMQKLNGKPFSLKEYEGKVVVLQIMGTWCPNCLDEVQFMEKLNQNYHESGLEIVALAYEVGTNTKEQRKKLITFKKRIGMSYDLILAGTSSKDVAAAQFPMLNGIMSFPTTVILGKDGKVLHVHTGYSGPATGEAHKILTDKIQLEIELALDLLK